MQDTAREDYKKSQKAVGPTDRSTDRRDRRTDRDSVQKLVETLPLHYRLWW